MTTSILLVLTLCSGYMTFDAFRLRASAKDAPFSVIASLWGNEGNHLTTSAQNQLRDRYNSFAFGVGNLALIFLAITVALAFATVRAFLE